MRANWTKSLMLATAVAAFGCSSSTTMPDSGPGPTGPEPYCVAAGSPCSVQAPCCTGSCIDSFTDAGQVCGISPAFWIDGGFVPGTTPAPNCAIPAAPACGCSTNSDCVSNVCVAAGCCGLLGGNLFDSPAGCACAADSDCLSGACSSSALCCAAEGCAGSGGSSSSSSGGSSVSSSGSSSSGSGSSVSSTGSSSSSSSGGSSSASCGSPGNGTGISGPGCTCSGNGDCGSDVCSTAGSCCDAKGSNNGDSPIGCACKNGGDCADGICTQFLCG